MYCCLQKGEQCNWLGIEACGSEQSPLRERLVSKMEFNHVFCISR